MAVWVTRVVISLEKSLAVAASMLKRRVALEMTEGEERSLQCARDGRKRREVQLSYKTDTSSSTEILASRRILRSVPKAISL